MGKAMKYRICRPSNEKEEEEFLNFWNENHEKRLNEKYKLWYQGNPTGKATVLLVKNNDLDDLVGCFVVFPRRMSINGVNLRAGVAGDFLVHKNHRVLVPALKLIKELVSIVKKDEFDVIYGFPNKSAEPVMKRAGFICLGPRIRMAKVVRISGYLREYSLYRCVDRLLSPFVDAAVRLLASETWYRSKGGFICEEISDFDERFSALWMKTKSRSQAMGERTAESLAWRYPNTGNTGHRIFAMSSSNRTELEGYLVYCLDDHSIRIRDFVLPDDGKAIRILVTHFLRHVSKRSVRSVEVHFLENRELLDILKRLGFVERKRDWNVYCYCSEQVLNRIPTLADSENWLVSDFDTDSFRV